MTPRATRTITSIGAQDSPAVSAFLRGYLHQDFREEHGTLAQAFQAFWADANADDRRRFLDEWRAFLALSEGRSWVDVRRALERLGAVWTPANRRAWSVLPRILGSRVQ